MPENITPTTENIQEGNQGVSIGTAAMIQYMQDQLQSMCNLVKAQQTQISHLTNELQRTRTTVRQTDQPQTGQDHTVVNSLPVAPTKIPQISSFSGTRDEKNSTKVRAFI